jgi:hypothetical protein
MNTFGPSPSQQYPLYDVREERSNRERFRREYIVPLERANSFYCPVGRWPSRGWILMSRGDYNKFSSPYLDSFQLNIHKTSSPNNVQTLMNLSIVQAQCVTRGLSTDSNALYLVELTDDRGILYNKWFQCPTTSMYNIRSPAYPDTFHPQSMNGTPSPGAGCTTWTWTTMLQNLWEQMNTIDGGNVLGPYPGLPIVPTGTPEGFWFSGVPAWYALNDILEHIGLTVACDLTKTYPFTIVQPGAIDSSLTNLQNKFITNLEDDLEWLDVGAARAPSTVVVLFRRRNRTYGTEETVTFGDDGIAKQWDMSSIYSVTGNAPTFFAGAVGSHYIWSDFTVRFDQNGIIMPEDAAMASQIAQERITQYFAKIYRQTAGFMTQTYAGPLPFSTGPQVDGVCWYQDYRSRDEYAGWRTQIIRGPYPPWSGLWD